MSLMSATTPKTPTRRALQVTAPLFAGLLLLGACSKKDETTTTNTTAASSSGGGSTTTAKAGGTTTTEGGSTGTTTGGSKGSTPTTAKGGSSLKDNPVWWEGFKITFDTVTLDKETSSLDIAAEIENLGPDNASIYGDYSLEADGTVTSNGSWKENPSIVAGSKAKDVLHFSVEDTYDPKKTTLVIGKGNQQQVRLPLAGSGDVVTLKPVTQEFKGEIKAGQLSIDVTKSEVRYDHIANHDQAAEGKAFLVLYATVKNTSAADTIYIDPSKIEITSADGTKSSVEKYDGEQSLNATIKDDKTVMYFEIDAPYDGEYSIEFAGAFGPDSADTTTTQKLAVKVGASSTTGTTVKKTG